MYAASDSGARRIDPFHLSDIDSMYVISRLGKPRKDSLASTQVEREGVLQNCSIVLKNTLRTVLILLFIT